MESGASTRTDQERTKSRFIANRRVQATTTSIDASPTSTTSVEQSQGVSTTRTCPTRRIAITPAKCTKRAPRQGGCHPWKPQQQSASELGLHCWAHNPNSLNSTKIRELTVRLNSYDKMRPHLLFFCETKFNETSQTKLDGYSLIRKDREGRQGGGVCIYALEEIKMIEVKDDVLNSKEIEQIWCIIHHGVDKILVGCMYRPPSSCLIDPHATNKVLSDSLREARLVRKSLGCSCIV